MLIIIYNIHIRSYSHSGTTPLARRMTEQNEENAKEKSKIVKQSVDGELGST